MTYRILFALLFSFLTVPVAAQSAADRLQTILGRVPTTLMEGQEGPIVCGWGNGDAVRWVAVRGAQAGRNPNTPNRFAALRSAAPNQRDIIAENADAALRAAVGLTALDWVNTWEVAQGNVRLGAMDIFPDSEMRLRGALFVRGFQEEDRGNGMVMWQGDVDYTPDPALEDPANPFGGDAGLPLRFVFGGDDALWATGWGALEAMQAPGGPTLSGRADAQALLAGLRRVGNLGQLASVRAWFRDGADLPINGAESGPVEALALADYARRETEGAAMVLLLAEDRDAEAIAVALTEAWPILIEEPSPATPEITVTGQAITLTISSSWGDDGAAANAGYEAFLSALNGGRLGFLLSR